MKRMIRDGNKKMFILFKMIYKYKQDKERLWVAELYVETNKNSSITS